LGKSIFHYGIPLIQINDHDDHPIELANASTCVASSLKTAATMTKWDSPSLALVNILIMIGIA